MELAHVKKQRGSRRFKGLLQHWNLQVHTLCHGTLYLEDDARSLGGELCWCGEVVNASVVFKLYGIHHVKVVDALVGLL